MLFTSTFLQKLSKHRVGIVTPLNEQLSVSQEFLREGCVVIGRSEGGHVVGSPSATCSPKRDGS